jgi:hypothetical protein
MKVLVPAKCPYCNTRVLRHEFFKSGPRDCRFCSAKIVPAEPWNWLGSIVLPIPFSIVLISAIFALIETPFFSPLALAGLGAILFFGYLTYPWVTPYKGLSPLPGASSAFVWEGETNEGSGRRAWMRIVPIGLMVVLFQAAMFALYLMIYLRRAAK